MNNYYLFLKNNLTIDEEEIKCIFNLTVCDELNESLTNEQLISIFMKKYLNNYNVLKEYINIKKLDFKELITLLNKIKNKAHFFFEDVNQNIPYYCSIINYLQNTSNILL